MAEQLHVKTSGEGDSNVVLLHGLFGSGNNLGQISRGLKEDHTEYIASICLIMADLTGCHRLQFKVMRVAWQRGWIISN